LHDSLPIYLGRGVLQGPADVGGRVGVEVGGAQHRHPKQRGARGAFELGVRGHRGSACEVVEPRAAWDVLGHLTEAHHSTSANPLTDPSTGPRDQAASHTSSSPGWQRKPSTNPFTGCTCSRYVTGCSAITPRRVNMP